MKKLLALAVLLLSSIVVPATAQVVITSEADLATIWETSHQAAHVCLNTLTRLNGPPIPVEERAPEIAKADDACAAVLFGTYLIGSSTVNVDSFVKNNNESQKLKELSEMQAALDLLKTTVGVVGARPFPTVEKAAGMIEVNELKKKTSFTL